MALAILAISAISLLAAAQAHVSRIDGLEWRVLAQFVAENRLAELELGVDGDDAPATMLGRDFRVPRRGGRRRRPRPRNGSTSRSATGARSQTFTGFRRDAGERREDAGAAVSRATVRRLIWIAAAARRGRGRAGGGAAAGLARRRGRAAGGGAGAAGRRGRAGGARPDHRAVAVRPDRRAARSPSRRARRPR